MTPSSWASATLAGLVVCAAPACASTKISISSGDTVRRYTPVTFQLPNGVAAGTYLEGANGIRLPLQVDEANNATIVLPLLPSRTKAVYTLVSSAGNASGSNTTVSREGSVLRFSHAGRDLLQYQMEPSEVPSPEVSPHYRHGGYLHPVYSPSGRIVTGDYPPDHRHHRGIWFSWTKTEFEGRHPDFWNMGKAKEAIVTAGTRFVQLESSWSGPVHAGFTSLHEAFDRTGTEEKVALNERWKLTLYAPVQDVAAQIFDLNISQKCGTTSALKLPEYYYGGLGVRGNAAWNPKDAVAMLTSEGHDRMAGDRTKGRWVWMGGAVDGGPTGMAILIHPDNFRFPQPLRLNPNNPQLCIAPSQGGDWEIVPGKPYVSKYRFVVFDGKPDPKELDRLWNDYAHPPTVKVE